LEEDIAGYERATNLEEQPAGEEGEETATTTQKHRAAASPVTATGKPTSQSSPHKHYFTVVDNIRSHTRSIIKCHSGPKETTKVNQLPQTIVTAQLISKKVFPYQHHHHLQCQEEEEPKEWLNYSNLLLPFNKAL
jgi:hypothetical protein